MKDKRYEFGPFELDPPQQRLRRRGIPVKLPVSRLRLLVLFVSRRGELITREEIAACLWNNEQSVDMISGINTAMKQLRTQLGDDPASPKYIETVVGAGYRFIAEVSEIEVPINMPAEALEEVNEPVQEERPSAATEAPSSTEAPFSPVVPRRFGRRAVLVLAATCGLAAPIAFFLLQASCIGQHSKTTCNWLG
jgi:DNA-binding winged helix-turn-helix (wHTH) protein